MLREKLQHRGVIAGVTPLQAILLNSNQIAPEAVRAGDSSLQARRGLSKSLGLIRLMEKMPASHGIVLGPELEGLWVRVWFNQ